MAKAFFSFKDDTITGKVFADLTVNYCVDIDGAPVSTANCVLTGIGLGAFAIENPNVMTKRALMRAYLTSNPSKSTGEIAFNPVDGDEAKESTLAAVKIQTDKLLFDGANNVKSTPQTAVTVTPAQATAGVLRALIAEGALVEWPRGDADRLTVALGSAYAKTGARFYLCIKADKTAQNTTALVNRELTITDAANVAGYIDLTAAEMAVGGKYYAEIERRDADGLSNPKTCWRAMWWISQDVRQ